MLHVFHFVWVRAWIFPLIPKTCQCLLFQTQLYDINARFPNFHYRGVLRFTDWSKFSVNGITIDPGPVLGEPIPFARSVLMVCRVLHAQM